MRLEDFNYHLPKELIAQIPCERRDKSKLMILHRKDGTVEHKVFSELTDYLKPGDVLVLNNTKVIPARLFGNKTTGGAVEVLLIQKSEVRGLPSNASIEGQKSEVWNCLINPSKSLKKNAEIIFEHGLKAKIAERMTDGEWLIELYAEIEIDKAIEKIGIMPLPPYIKRGKGQGARSKELDIERYQTVFAKEKGAIAAPTAGLHFTDELLKKIQELGVQIFYITLHTGLGTFKPVKTENITKHKMEPEYYKVAAATFKAIKKAKHENRRIIAVGSTVAKTLEAIVRCGWEKPILSGYTNLFIYPGYKFNAADALITNFHLPKSTLLMLVSALAGQDFIKKAYQEAIKQSYRFFSYGDAMMII
ncbi:MAG: tRNA preQ1(34) S-adenosylmethionine ribosyltransferase-isomerase QueA [Deltaproteobacteria bacterium]|nr:tRNA preQ1(34) S-adenosylmethionine ribosyltransferase-isomerase QueA [Deltaproteobacteria bacterium]